MSDNKRLFHLFCGPVLFALCLGLIPDSTLALPTRTAVGTMLWMGWWWVSMPVNPAADCRQCAFYSCADELDHESVFLGYRRLAFRGEHDFGYLGNHGLR